MTHASAKAPVRASAKEPPHCPRRLHGARLSWVFAAQDLKLICRLPRAAHGNNERLLHPQKASKLSATSKAMKCCSSTCQCTQQLVSHRSRRECESKKDPKIAFIHNTSFPQTEVATMQLDLETPSAIFDISCA